MNRFFVTLFTLAFAASGACAQSAQVKNAAKSTFRLTAYDSAGNVMSNTCGVFTSADGEAIGAWSALASAARADVTDANGKTYAVRSLLGANELYDVCRFRVDAPKTPSATLVGAVQPKGTKLWLVYSENKKVTTIPYEVEREENFMDKYGYYIFAYNDKSGAAGSPFVNANGEVAGLLQQSETSLDIHAVDARFVTSLTFTALDINNPLYSKSGIRLQLPKDNKQAQLMMMLSAEQGDSAKYAGYISDYIEQFPTDVDGYSTSAMRKVSYGDFAGADADMQTALKKVANKAEAHSEYARVMYQKLVYSNDSLYTPWTLDKALDQTDQAYKLDPQPGYLHRKAQILYSKKNFGKAYDIFSSLSKSSMSNNSEVFFEAAQCKTQLGAPKEEILALLDSAVAHCQKPYTAVSAPYILTRGQMRDAMKDYRGAISDYNTYDTLMVGRASADFYYTRSKCETNLRQYQQALNDMAHAAVVAQADMRPVYLAEMASLQLRVNRLDDAVRTADLCLQMSPEDTDALIIKGVALNAQKKKKESVECLQRAKELGDPRGDEYLKKYSK